MPKRRLFGHIHSDPDLVTSMCAATRFVPGMEDAERVWVGGRYDGSGMGPDDLAVDMPAGGRGVKGRITSNAVHSSLAMIVERYGSAEDRAALKYLVDYIDSHDSCGSVVSDKAPNASGLAKWVLGGASLAKVIFAIKLMHTNYDEDTEEVVNEETVFQRVLEIFDGILQMDRKGIAIEEGIDIDYAEYLLRGHKKRKGAVAIRSIFRFYDIKRSIESRGTLVADELLGDSVDQSIRTLFAKNSIDAVFAALKYRHRGDWELFESRVSEILNGFLKMDEADRIAEAAANRAELFAGGKVALTRGGPAGTDNVLRRRGAVAIVYKDGINCGVVVKPVRGSSFVLKDGTVLTADHPAVMSVIKRSGDPLDLWFIHPAKFLVANGTQKAPTDTESLVNEYDLVNVLCDLVQWKI